MFRRVLVPLDGSELARNALRYARTLAQAPGSRLILVRAAEAHPLLGVNVEQQEISVTRTAEQELEAVCDDLTTSGLEAEWHVYYGPAAKAILEEVDMRQADSIVMSTHGRSGLAKLVLGSVAEEVVTHASVPVLLAPARCQLPWPPSPGGRIVLALDGSKLAEGAVSAALELAESLEAGLLLAGFVPPATAGYGPEVYQEEDYDAELLSLNSYLDEVSADVRRHGIPCSALADVADPRTAIVELARQTGASAVVMATHGRQGLARAVVGSVTSSVVHGVCTPVLVVRPQAVERATVEEVTAVRTALAT